MIALCQSEDSLNEVFFSRGNVFFWVPPRTEKYTDFFLHECTDDLTKDRWLCISSKDLTQWSEE